MSNRMAMVVFVFLLAAGCGRSSEPDSGRVDGRRYLRCAEPYSDGTSESFRLPPLTVVRNGFDLQIQGIQRGLIVLGLLSGITEPTEANFRNLDYFLARFREAGVQALLVAGDVGLEEAHVEAILGRLAAAPVPVLLTPGAQENLDVFRRALAKARPRHPQLIDMTHVRRVRIGQITVVSLPGYYKPFYLLAGDRGCSYEAKDLELTAALFDEKNPNLVMAPSPPRCIGPFAVDRGRGGINLGDAELARVLAAHNVKLGLFGYAYEAGGNATLADGKTAALPGIWQESLYIQSGSAEALPLSLNERGRSVGMAQIVEISGARARYQTLLAQSETTAQESP